MKSLLGLFGHRDRPTQSSAPGETQRVLSLLRPEEARSLGGLPGEAICGVMMGEDVAEANFRPNRVFIDFMHGVISRAGPNDPSLQAAARAQRQGYVYVIDLRTPEGPGGRVPVEDIVGGFKVENGVLVEGGYWANDKHKIFSKDGLVRLPPRLHEALRTELMKCEVAS